MSQANDNPQFDSSVVGALFRFFNSFERNTATYCWEWRSTLNTDGYAVMSIADRQHRAYRWFYEHCFGALDEGLTLDHLCRVRHCVNPRHLEPVTNAENILRGDGPFAVNARKTKCKYGHDFHPFLRTTSGHRVCVECRRRRTREWMQADRARKKAKREAARQQREGAA